MSKKRVVLNHSINSGKKNVGDEIELPSAEADELISIGSATLTTQRKTYSFGVEFDEKGKIKQ